MPFSTTYPASPPSISGDNIQISTYLANPPRVSRLLDDLTSQRFIADRLFAPGPRAVGGAVIFDQVTAQDLFLTRDVERIRPGQEYPILTDEAPTPRVAAVDKWGGRIFITDEQRDRNAFDVFVRETRKLANTVIRKVDQIAIGVLDAAPVNQFAAANDWTTSSGAAMVNNLIDAAALINDSDLGYIADLVFLNPTQFNELLKNKDFRDALGPQAGQSILREGIIGQFLGIDFGRSNRVAPGTGYIASQQLAGSISDEVPLATKTYREEGEDSTYIQSARRVVPYVTDPKAVVRITGI